MLRLRRRRGRAYATTSNTASHDNHEEIHRWVSFSFLYEYGAPLGGPSSLRVVEYPPPEEKREGGNVYEKLTRIVLCDVKVIYVSMLNKLYFPRKNVCTRAVLTQTN